MAVTAVLNTAMKSYQIDLYKNVYSAEDTLVNRPLSGDLLNRRPYTEQLQESVAKLHTIARLIETEMNNERLVRDVRILADRVAAELRGELRA